MDFKFTTDVMVKNVVKSTPIVKNQKLSTLYKRMANSCVNLHNRQLAI